MSFNKNSFKVFFGCSWAFSVLTSVSLHSSSASLTGAVFCSFSKVCPCPFLSESRHFFMPRLKIDKLSQANSKSKVSGRRFHYTLNTRRLSENLSSSVFCNLTITERGDDTLRNQ
jgi:hypothetical protein